MLRTAALLLFVYTGNAFGSFRTLKRLQDATELVKENTPLVFAKVDGKPKSGALKDAAHGIIEDKLEKIDLKKNKKRMKAMLDKSGLSEDDWKEVAGDMFAEMLARLPVEEMVESIVKALELRLELMGNFGEEMQSKLETIGAHITSLPLENDDERRRREWWDFWDYEENGACWFWSCFWM